MRAAFLHTTGDETLDVRDVESVSFGPGRVRVKMHKAGLCHSDLSAMSGVLTHPAPFIPGHEGAGEVVEVGEGVTHVSPGDRVIVCWMPPCDTCPSCRAGDGHLCRSGYRNLAHPNFKDGDAIVPGMLGAGTFAEEVVIAAYAAIPIPDDVPYDIAALIGCGVTTGIGAALNTAKVRPGSSVVVIGLGGVGISILQGAKVAGAAQIIAVDPTPNRREWALKFGATEAIAPEELAEVSERVTGGFGFDYAFEAVGKPGTLRAAYDATRLGGTVCLVGAGFPHRRERPEHGRAGPQREGGSAVLLRRRRRPPHIHQDHRSVACGPHRPRLDDHAPRAADGDQRGDPADAHG